MSGLGLCQDLGCARISVIVPGLGFLCQDWGCCFRVGVFLSGLGLFQGFGCCFRIGDVVSGLGLLLQGCAKVSPEVTIRDQGN